MRFIQRCVFILLDRSAPCIVGVANIEVQTVLLSLCPLSTTDQMM